MRKFFVWFLTAAFMLPIAACGGSHSTTAAQNQAKAQLAQLEKKDPKLKGRVQYAESHALGCVIKVKGKVVKNETKLLSCIGVTPAEEARAKPCVNKALQNISIFSLNKTKAENTVDNVVVCTVR
jgi:hypothetical protein